jgi:DNA-binding NarL/FixJ family response regulator
MFRTKVHLQTRVKMISAHDLSHDRIDLRRLPRATLAEIKANKLARNKKYCKKTMPPGGFSPKLWTARERELVLHSNGYSDHKLSEMLCRSVTSIQVYRSKIKSGKK